MPTEPNTVFPHRGDYRRPDRADDYQPIRVIARAATTDGTAVQRAHATMNHAKEEFARFLDTVKEHRDRFSDKGYRAQVALFTDTDAARAVDTALKQVRDRREKAQARVDETRRGLAPDGDVAAELRATRFWGRTKAVLDNLDPGKVSQAARDLLTKANRAELGTVLQEIRPYLESRGQASDWLDAALAQVVPEYASARTELTKADQALTITKYNAEALRRGFSEGQAPLLIVDPAKYDPDHLISPPIS